MTAPTTTSTRTPPTTLNVLVTVGTDHHPFDRLVGWCDQWAAAHPDDRMTIQYGTARPPGVAAAHEFFAPEELMAEIAGADVVICQGGPATIAEIRAAGKLPIVVPRLAAYGEVVDDHQVSFAARLAQDGVVKVAARDVELATLLDEARAEPDAFMRSNADDRTARSTRLFGDLMDALGS